MIRVSEKTSRTKAGPEGDRLPAGRAEVGVVHLPGGFPMERESPIRPARIGYEWLGNPEGPTVVALGGISADRHVGSHVEDDRPGWWDVFVGPGRPLDTDRYRIVGVDWIGGPGASSAPHRRPGPQGIPAVTTGDQAAAVAAVLDHLEVSRVHAFVGASYGSMVGLAFGARFPERARRILAISGAHESHPMATALRSLQRRIVLFGYEKGDPKEALVIARSLAMTTYRSPGEFRDRFSQAPSRNGRGYRFEVEDYLEYNGRKFAARYDPDHFLYLCQSLDIHRVDPKSIRVPVTLVAVEEDDLIPLWQMRELHRGLGKWGEIIEISSPTGHDAFLTDEPDISAALRRVLEDT